MLVSITTKNAGDTHSHRERAVCFCVALLKRTSRLRTMSLEMFHLNASSHALTRARLRRQSRDCVPNDLTAGKSDSEGSNRCVSGRKKMREKDRGGDVSLARVKVLLSDRLSREMYATAA